MAEIKHMLDEEIKRRLEDLSEMETGSQKKSIVIDEVSKLHKLRIEEMKTEAEIYDRRERLNEEKNQKLSDTAYKTSQLEESKKDRYFKLGVAAAEIILPMIFYAVWMYKGFKFEEEGVLTSTTFKGLYNRFKPTK